MSGDSYGATFNDGTQTFHGVVVAGGKDVTVNVTQQAVPIVPQIVFSVPYGVSAVFGRTDELATLARLLADGTAVAVTGIGGTGKSFLAAQFAHVHKADYPGGVFWLDMADPGGVAAQVAATGGVWLPGWTGRDVAADAAAVLRMWQESVARLLVFDNCEDAALLDAWRPKTGGCRVLITSRNALWPTWSGVTRLALQTLLPEPARNLLCTPRAAQTGVPLADVTADPAADAICDALGYLPLALALAAAFLAAIPDLSLAGYLTLLGQNVDVLADEALATADVNATPTHYRRGVAAAFAVSYDRLQVADATDALAQRLLHRAALLAPAPIPRLLLLRAGSLDGAATKDVVAFGKAVTRLAAVGLVTEEATVTVTVHRLVAAFARSRATDSAGDKVEVEATLIVEGNRLANAGLPREATLTLPHLRYLADAAYDRTDNTAALLCNALARVVVMSADYGTARRYYERAVAIAEAMPDVPQTALATYLSNLALLLQSQGDYAAARPLLERALTIYEKEFGEKHPLVATGLNNLAGLLKTVGDYAAARPLYERALAIREEALGPMHPDTATSLNNLALLLQSQGDYTAARPLYERALAINEKELGDKHPLVATSLNNLAGLLFDTGDYAAARSLYERSITLREQAQGPNHPALATNLNNLALVLKSQGDYAAARPLYARALAIREEALGPMHPATATSLNNLAGLLEDAGDYAAARPLCERAVAIMDGALGPEHPSTQTVRANLARLVAKMGEGGGEGGAV